MDEFAGRLLAERYRLPLPPAEEYELRESRAYDTASGQEVLVRQVPLPEIVEAELLDETGSVGRPTLGRATRTPSEPAVRRAVEAALAASHIPDHPRLDQVFDVFVEDDGLWVVSEVVAARPLAAVLAERPITPHRAAEIAADLLAALSAVHTYGWTHRNITTRTVLICEDGRALLTGLASGAAEEALSGYDPLPTEGPMAPLPLSVGGPEPRWELGSDDAELPRQLRADAQLEAPGGEERTSEPDATAERAASRSGAIAAYRAGAAAARSEPAIEERRDFEAEELNLDPDNLITDDEHAARAAESGEHGPWGGDKPGPPMAIPVQLGYRPKQPFVGMQQPDEDELGPLESAEAPYRKADLARDQYPDTWHGADLDAGLDPEPQSAGHLEAEPEPEPVPEREYEFEAEPQDALEPDPGERWGAPSAVEDGRYRGPVSSLAAERARQARMTMVGAVTERWAPEQAGPVYENWRLAPPVGPAADLWALGSLLFRAVQGHAPYPEENAAELVQLVCSEPPAFAEECGPLRPVIESLLRQDPTERPEFEELSGWLRSLIRSAPEPDAGLRVINAQLPPAGGRADPRRLPIIRRRGELVRRRRTRREPARAEPVERRKHRRKRAPARRRQAEGDPRRLGRLVLVGVLLAVTAVMVAAVMLMPGTDGEDGNQRGSVNGAPTEDAGDGASQPPDSDEGAEPSGSQKPDSSAPQSSAPGTAPEGYELQQDPAGFQIAVPDGWTRGQSSDGQVRYRKGALELIVVPGRDSADKYGDDPRDYQLSGQPELADYRASTGWKVSSGVRTITVGETAMAEGEFGWESGGKQQVLRNRAMLLGGKYHVVLVRGPKGSQAEIDEHFTTVADTYRSGS